VSDETYFYDERVGDVRVQVWREGDDRPWFVTFLPDHKRGHAPSSGRTLAPGGKNVPPDFPASDDPAELRDWAKAYARRKGAD
jgi:hypothetical protein